MATQHAKSPCCRGRIYKFGKRRKQCSICKHTWRIRRKRRGRKRKRISPRLAIRTLMERQTLVHQKRHGNISQSGWSRRFTKALLTTGHMTRVRHMSAGSYALLGDDLYFKFERIDWVMYIMAVKPVRSHHAYFLDPVLLIGKESYERWRQALATIPPRIQKRILAFVSDGFRGSKLIAKEHGWIHQRCHFHLLAAMIRRHGRRSYRIKGGIIREKLLVAVRALLTTTDEATLQKQKRYVRCMISHPLCPTWIRKQTIEFLRTLDDFRAYLLHPSLNLPTTTNAIESAGKLIRKATITARTPESVLFRTTACLRLKKFVTCNGKFSTKLCQ